jgi:hypothetical protein
MAAMRKKRASLTAWRTGEVDPERAFESVLMNGRKARESGLWRKAWAAPAVAVVPAAVPAERRLLIRWRSCSVRTARDHTQSFLKPRRDEVEEGPKLQRLLRLCDKYDLHWVRRWRPIGQYRDQCPATGAGRCLIGHYTRDPESCDGAADHAKGRIDRKASL